jgi:hypothetical protein
VIDAAALTVPEVIGVTVEETGLDLNDLFAISDGLTAVALAIET